MDRANIKHQKTIKFSASLPATQSSYLLITLAPSSVGLFRFMLEAYENLALFKVLDARIALVKLMFSPHQYQEVQLMLEMISAKIDYIASAWPWSSE